jgi:hypothetical protein
MLERATPWPKLFALLLAGGAVSNVFSSWLLTYGANGPWPSITFDWHPIAISAVLFIVSYFVACGFSWARLILLAGVVLLPLRLLIRHGVYSVVAVGVSDVPPEQVPILQLQHRLHELSAFVGILTVVIFGVLLLLHPDVARSFRRGPRSDAKA